MSRGDGNTRVLLAAIASAIVLLAIAGVVFLVWVGRPVDSTLALIMAIAAPTVVALLNMAKATAVAGTMEQIKDQTNGALSALATRLDELEREQRQQYGPGAVDPARTHRNEPHTR